MPERPSVELLYFDGCPSHGTAEEVLRRVLAEEGIEARVDLVAVNTDEEARRLRFPGSPTIRVDGRDLFPSSVSEREDWRPVCRVYATPEGFKGSPTAGMIREVLSRMLAAGERTGDRMGEGLPSPTGRDSR